LEGEAYQFHCTVPGNKRAVLMITNRYGLPDAHSCAHTHGRTFRGHGDRGVGKVYLRGKMAISI